MCERCHAEATGVRSGKGVGVISKLIGLRACEHTPECKCDECCRYRSKNPYSDMGIFLNQTREV